jgi:hypothetical protein
MLYLKISRRINLLKFPRAISRVTVELKTSVSEISSASIVRVDPDDGFII